MKLIEVQFESEADREAGAFAIIAIREKQAEPQFAQVRKPSLMVWETEREAFAQEMQRQGVAFCVDHETEISVVK